MHEIICSLCTQEVVCSEFNSVYEIYFTGYESVDARNCVDKTCSVVFTEFSANVREYFLTIMATNHSHIFSTKIGENEYCARSGCIEYLPHMQHFYKIEI